MEVWYVTSDINQELPRPFETWLCENVNKIFLSGEEQEWMRSKDIFKFFDTTPAELELNQDFSCSFNLARSIIEQCQTHLKPVYIIINNNNRALPYYLLQNYWCNHPALSKAIIITIHNSSLEVLDNSDKYKFPEYWVSRKNHFSVSASHYVLTWNKNVKESLGDSSKVLFLENEGHLDLFKCFERDAGRQLQEYPINSSMPVRDDSDSLITEGDLLSVIIPFYNMGSLLLETIKSIRESTYSDIEIIIVNDGTDDEESIDVLHEIESTMPFIKVIHISNKGLSNARNVGASAAKGTFISFLDSDDLVDPIYYERCISILKSYKNVSFVYSWVRFFGLRNDVWVTFDTEFPLLLLTNMLSAFAVIRKNHFLNYGLNKVEMEKGMEDHESWISMCENGCAGVSIPEALVYYRIRSNSMSRQFNRRMVNELYFKISNFHEKLYEQYGKDIFNLLYSNGPGYIWNNPAIPYPDIGYISNESQDLDNNLKYELMRIFNSKRGRHLINLFIKLKLNKWFK